MNTYENIIQESMKNMQASPEEELKARIMKSIATGNNTSRVYRHRISVRMALIAAVIACFILTTAFAFGTEIYAAVSQLVFGDSTATQIVYFDDDNKIGSVGIMNRTDLEDATDYPLGLFDTIEEAREAAPFHIREPAYLPKGVSALRSVAVWRVEAEYGPWMHLVDLYYDVPFILDGTRMYGGNFLSIRQMYGGPEAYITVSTVFNLEKAMVRNNEAVFIINEGANFINDEGETITQSGHISLWWMNDGIAFELTNLKPGIVDQEAMIRIAESIR
jgi:hypothetical protein